MRQSGLRLDRIPPANIPFRFFLTAPWFAILAALLLLANGPETWTGLRNPVLIGITHLMTLGFVTMVMLGALFQLLPVLGGKSVPAARRVAFVVHIFLVTGVLFLCTGFVLHDWFLFRFALPALLIAVGCFVFAIGSRLVTVPVGADSIQALRLAVSSLLAAAAIGIYLALGYLYPLATGPGLTAFHMGWALIGWLLILVMGVSFQVIPMFQVTPDYPRLVTRVLPALLFAILLLAAVLPAPYAVQVSAGMLGMAVLVYAITSLRLLHRRKRRGRDATVRFWQLGLSCLALSVPLFWLALLAPAAGAPEAVPHKAWLLTIVLALAGFAVSVIMGMLQKIIPFLAYLHLQRRHAGNTDAIRHLPHVHVIIRPRHSGRLLNLHATAVLALAAAVIYPPLTRPAAVVLVADFGWLTWLVTGAMVFYARTGQRLAAVTPD
jgi:hypothetical protein